MPLRASLVGRRRRLHRLLADTPISALGFGGYRVTDSAPHRAALQTALERGCSLVDTSPNYTDGGSERLIGSVLASLPSDQRPLVVTKVGTLQGAALHEAAERERSGRPWPNVVKLSSSAWLCLAPEYIAHSVDQSTRRLGAPPDVVLLHNP
eukprot:2806268-Prymnesium_polylepis.1